MTHKTNTAAVRDMMEHSNFGALAQLFIIDAISKYSEAVSKATPESVDTGLIAGAAWVGVAKEIRAKMDAHLNVKRQKPSEDHPQGKAISAATFQHSLDAEQPPSPITAGPRGNPVYVDAITDGDGITRQLSRPIRLL